MALKQANTTPAAQFEGQDAESGTAAVLDAPATKPAPAAEVAANDPGVQTSLVVAKASAGALITPNEAAANAKRFQKEVADMKGSSDFSFGNYETFKANNGSIVGMTGDKTDLGRWAKVRLIAWDEHYECSPGTDDGKDYVAYSKDGITIDSVIGEEQRSYVGKTVNEYLAFLEAEGFDRAKVRRFIDTGCALLATDNGEGPIGSVIQVTLSESSIPAFSRYQQQLQDNAKCVAMGIPGFTLPADPFTFFMIREAASKGDRRWTKLKISQTLPAKL
jgi:hypothetical protein